MQQATYYNPPVVLGKPNGIVLDVVNKSGSAVDLARPGSGEIVVTNCRVVDEPQEGTCVLVAAETTAAKN